MLAGGEDLNAQADPDLLHRLAAELLAMGAAIVGLKLGTQGFYLLTTREVRRLAAAGRCAPRQPSAWAGQELLAPCFAVEVMGTTGSGDCTIAGFLGALLKGLSAEDAMTAAVAAGACSVERADAVSGLPDWSVVQQRIAAGWPRRETSLHLKGWRYDPAQQVWRRA
jgi:sugar/nucleoside kinase (ribokinase family)